jgi:hypothetical protein
MNYQPIPDNIQRFILSSIESVAFLEALLLLRYDPKKNWDPKSMAQGLFVSEKRAEELLSDLCSAGFAEQEDNQPLFHYHPVSRELKEMLDQLSEIYSKNLIEVTNLIHSRTARRAQEFGDAFKWEDGKDPS